MFKRVYFIINPASGKVEPILSYINKTVAKTDFDWDIGITHKKRDAFDLTKYALRKNFDLIVVYGGDGTVMEVAQALYKRKTPMLILPGGTANIMAKEIGIRGDAEQAIKLLKRSSLKLITVDMALFNERPFVLRINIGILADLVKSTKRGAKEKFGRLAYSVAALKHVLNHDKFTFSMNIDGKEIVESGVALMIANVGNIGIRDFSVLPNVKVNDGYLDVILFKTAAIHTWATWFRSFFTQKKPFGSIKHWKGKNISLKFKPKTQIICDDIPIGVDSFRVKIVPQSLTVVVP